MPLDWILQVVVDNAFGYSLDQTGIAEQLRSKLGLDTTKQAFNHALNSAFKRFEEQHYRWAASLCDSSFFEKEGASVLAQFLIRDGHPHPNELVKLWAKSLNIQPSELSTLLVSELQSAAVDFLDYLDHSLKAESALRELNDSRTLEDISSTIYAIHRKLNSNQATLDTHRDYLRWLIERNLYLDPRGTFQTQRQVQMKLDEVYVSLRAQHEEAPVNVDRHIAEKELAELETKMASPSPHAEEVEDQWEQFFNRFIR